ncbi:hypothetical protein IE53DRAFT_384207 [Violaceomyces palustris]|uniref:Uncharacterized protein n=1 Tax=Violaceomyces palustris TaxID=1673888 RepID=A0ACD0P5D9_9BASI|nr:hypothetical protein IE53DRAFT_384207 [Violaceomyces palustris]
MPNQLPSLKHSIYYTLVLAISVVFYYYHNPLKTNPSQQVQPAIMTSLISRTVVKKVRSIETAEGAGAVVRRSIGSPALRNISPFLMLDHFRISEGSGFPDHPHRGQTTVTYMLEGQVQHEDFAGHAGTIGPGDLQWMNAGRGIMHAEMPIHRDEKGNKLPDPIGLQLWIDLPKDAKKDPPSYQEFKSSQIPTALPRPTEPVETEGQGWVAKVVAGRSHGVESPVKLPRAGGVTYIVVDLQPGGRIFQEIPKGYQAFIYTLKGKIRVGQGEVYEQFHTLVLSNDVKDEQREENGVWIENADAAEEAKLTLISGEPLDQGVFQYGPFVLTTREEVQQTLIDFQLGKNGFERAAGWRSTIGGR